MGGNLTSDEIQTFRLQAAIRRSGIPERFRGGFDAFNPGLSPEAAELKRRAVAYAEAFDPTTTRRGLVMVGPTGSGKTALAAAISEAILKSGRATVAWVNSVELFARIRATWGRDADEDEIDLIGGLIAPDLLIIDDLGAERPTAWIAERLYLVLNGRWERRRPVILTMNCNGRELIDRMTVPDAADLAERIVSRIAGLCDPLGTFPKIDFRKAAR